MDLDPLRWVRDFVLLGAGIGGLAPLVVLVPMSWSSGWVQLPYLVALGIAVAGAALGIAVGTALWGAASLLGEHPMLLAPLGFPVGATAGMLVGATVGSFLHAQAVPVVGGLGMITGGLTLGLAWLPYLALKLAGRSGLPVVLTGVFGSPMVGALAMFTFYWMGI